MIVKSLAFLWSSKDEMIDKEISKRKAWFVSEDRNKERTFQFIRIKSRILLSICKHANYTFSVKKAEAWGVLLGRQVEQFRVIESVKKLRFGRDYHHNTIWNIDEYNLTGLPRLVELERNKNSEFVGSYHTHPYRRFEVFQHSYLDTSLSQNDALTFDRLHLKPNAVVFYISLKEARDDSYAINKWLTFFSNNSFHKADAACYVAFWNPRSSAPLPSSVLYPRQAIGPNEHESYVLTCLLYRDKWSILVPDGKDFSLVRLG